MRTTCSAVCCQETDVFTHLRSPIPPRAAGSRKSTAIETSYQCSVFSSCIDEKSRTPTSPAGPAPSQSCAARFRYSSQLRSGSARSCTTSIFPHQMSQHHHVLYLSIVTSFQNRHHRKWQSHIFRSQLLAQEDTDG